MAIVAVVIFQFLPDTLSGGFAGVDVFFVISGFLMTNIIFKKLEQNNFSIIEFYLARVRRIIPSLIILVVTLLIFGWFYLAPLDYKSLARHSADSLSFFSNIRYLKESGYFDNASYSKWLLHTWSLSVEWQFYLLFPIFLVLLKKAIPLVKLKSLLVVCLILSFCWSLYQTNNNPDHAFYILFTRTWELLLGSMVCLYPIKLKEKSMKFCYFFGIAIIMLSYFLITEELAWPGYAALLPTLATCLIIVANHNKAALHNNKFTQIIGSAYYSIYLWHWPIAALLYSLGLHQKISYSLFGILASFMLGFIAYFLIEKNLAKLSEKLLNISTLSLLVFVLIIAKYISAENGFAQRLPADFVQATTAPSEITDTLCGSSRPHGKPRLKTPFCSMGEPPEKQNDTLIFGDSFAAHWQPFWQELAKDNYLGIDSLALSSCWASSDDSYLNVSKSGRYYQQCLIHRQYIKDHADQYSNIILGSMWGGMHKKGHLEEGLKLIKQLQSQGVKVIIMPSPTHYNQDVMKRYTTSIFNEMIEFDLNQEGKDDDIYAIEANQILEDYAENNDQVFLFLVKHYLIKAILLLKMVIKFHIAQMALTFPLSVLYTHYHCLKKVSCMRSY